MDISNALALEGVFGIYTGKDLAELTNPLRMAPAIDGLKPVEMTTLPIDKVLFQGDLVACVIAKNRYIAEDAIELVNVEYESLLPVTNITQAQENNSPFVDEGLQTNLLSHQLLIGLSNPSFLSIVKPIYPWRREVVLLFGMRGVNTSIFMSAHKLLTHIGPN